MGYKIVDAIIDTVFRKSQNRVAIEGEARIRFSGAVLAVLSTMQAVPFRWNFKKQSMGHCSGFHLIYWLISGPAFSIINGLSIVTQLSLTVELMKREDLWHDPKTLGTAAISISYIATSLGFAFMQGMILRHVDEIIRFWNELITWRIKLIKDGASIQKDFNGAKILVGVVLLRTIAVILAGASHPYKSPHLPALFPETWRTSVVHKSFIICYAVTTLAGWSVIILSTFMILVFQETEMGAVEHIRSLKSGNVFEKKIRLYKETLLINRSMEDAFLRNIYPTFLSTITIVLIVSFFGVVRCFGKIHIKLYLPFVIPVFGIAFVYIRYLVPAAEIAGYSAEAKREMLLMLGRKVDADLNNRINKRYLSRRVDSMPCIRTRIGPFLFVERSTFLVVLGLVMYNGITLLINY